MNCDHRFIEVGDRRWCVRLLVGGGCGGFWTRSRDGWRLRWSTR